jgi:SAM-dependent methyltransferase
VDISAGQLELAGTNAPAATFVRADMTEVAFAPRSFDAVVAFWTLIHVRRELHAGILGRIHDWLRPGGFLAGTFGSGDNPAQVEERFHGAPMYWSHFDAVTNRRLFREAGFELVQADEIEDEDETPLWVIARRDASGIVRR